MPTCSEEGRPREPATRLEPPALSAAGRRRPSVLVLELGCARSLACVVSGVFPLGVVAALWFESMNSMPYGLVRRTPCAASCLGGDFAVVRLLAAFSIRLPSDTLSAASCLIGQSAWLASRTRHRLVTMPDRSIRSVGELEREYPSAAACLAEDLPALTVHLAYPLRLKMRLRSTNLLERSLEEVRRRTRRSSAASPARRAA